MLPDSKIVKKRTKWLYRKDPALQRKLIADLQQLIDDGYREHRHPKYYSDRLSVTLKLMDTICKAHFKKTVFGLIVSRIIKEAEALLGRSGMLCREIALELGFRDPNYFSRFFFRETGVRPRGFRKKIGYKGKI